MNTDIIIFYPLWKEVHIWDVSFRTTRETKQLVNSILYSLQSGENPAIWIIGQVEKNGWFEFTVSLLPGTSIADIREKFTHLLERIPDFTITPKHE